MSIPTPSEAELKVIAEEVRRLIRARDANQWVIKVKHLVATVGTLVVAAATLSWWTLSEIRDEIQDHVTNAHAGSYNPRYPGDTVNRALEESRTEFLKALRDEALDSERKFERINVKLDRLLQVMSAK